MNNKQIFINAFERHIVDKPPVRIKVNGNFVKTVSGKSGWQTVAQAKAALKHHFSEILDYEEMDRMFGRRDEKWGLFLEEMIRDGVLESWNFARMPTKLINKSSGAVFRVAGIGSRKIRDDQEKLLFKLGEYIGNRNWTLSSGNANGSDEWFARGVNSVNPKRVMLYLPWDTYNKELIHPDNRCSSDICSAWVPVAEKCHPNWDALKSSVRSLMIRNVGIVSRANIVLALPSRTTGGTRHGMSAAKEFGVPVVDLLEGELDFVQICDILNREYEKFRASK